MSGNQDQRQEPSWEAKSNSSDESTSKQSPSREEFMAMLRQASNAPCPSRAEMIAQFPTLENERTVKSSLDIIQNDLSNDSRLTQRGESQIAEFRKLLEKHANLGDLPALSPQDATEIGRITTTIDKRCIESRIGRTS